jgi:hypothetical protein
MGQWRGQDPRRISTADVLRVHCTQLILIKKAPLNHTEKQYDSGPKNFSKGALV